MLQLVNLKKVYSSTAGNMAALNGVSLTFPDSGMVFITGKSGSGKTTLLNTVGGLDGFDDGDILIDGKPFSTFSLSDYASYRNTVVGFVFQEYNLLPDYTVEKNLKIATELQGLKTSDEEVNQLLELVDLKGLNKRKPSELSGGQMQRVAIARALVKNPRIIMADEPTGALDQATGLQVMDTLKKLSKSKLIVVVSHDMEIAEKYGDRIIRLVDGRLAEDVTITDKEITSNVYQQDGTFNVKKGAQLSETETAMLVSAIRENKKIAFFKNDHVRIHNKTEKQPQDTSDGTKVKLVSSKMKASSSMLIGVKALGVKPIRLILTILFSVIAFALFGIFDTLYTFDKAKVIADMLTEGNFPSITASARYANEGLSSKIRVSQETIDAVNAQSNYKFRGLYEIDDNSFLGIGAELPITQPDLANAPQNGANYYYKLFNDFVEFDETEIFAPDRTTRGTGVAGDVIDPNGFNLKIVAGAYPTLPQPDEDGYTSKHFQNVAISKYMAESLLFWFKACEKPQYSWKDENGELIIRQIKKIEDFVGVPLELDNTRTFYITGIVDCGSIPDKYDSLKTRIPNTSTRILAEDLITFLDAGLFFKLFVPQGYVETYREFKNRATKYFTNTVNVNVNGIALKGTNYTSTAFYKYSEFVEQGQDGVKNSNNIIMFGPSEDGKLFKAEPSLSKRQIIINVKDFEKYYKSEIKLAGSVDLGYLDDISYNGKGYYEKSLQNVLDVFVAKNIKTLNKTENNKLTLKKNVTVTKQLSNSATVSTFDCEIVGVYFGVDKDIYVPYNGSDRETSPYPLMVSNTFMNDLGICSTQDMYFRMISPATSNPQSIAALSKMFTINDGIKIVWFGNTILNTLNSNQQTLSQLTTMLLYFAIALAAFSIFMLFNYISVSISSRKRSVGVLKGLGCNNRDICRIFFTESIIIAIVNGLLACVFAGVGCLIVNSYIQGVMGLNISFAIYGIRQILLIFGASLLTGFVSSLIPIIKICRKKPVKLIRNP